MRCQILHESRGRLRVHLDQKHMTLAQADLAEAYFRSLPFVTAVAVYDRSCNVAVSYSGTRENIIGAFARFHYEDPATAALMPEHSGRALSREYEQKLVFRVLWHYSKRIFLPLPLRCVLTGINAVRYVCKGLRCLLHGKLEVPVLDATAVAVSVLRGDFETASSVMFLLGIGETLEEWTHKKSVDDLAATMSLNVDRVWLHTPEGTDVLVPVKEIRTGDILRVGTGNMIPLDGKVVSGEVTVNQSSMTGESAPVRKTEHSLLYAGTVVEEGDCLFRVEKTAGEGRYDRIVRMIEESEKLKSDTEAHAEHLADGLVPWSLGGTLLAWLITRNPARALSILMVDFSCALKLAMPISVLSAMKECGKADISVKGGKFLEAIAAADTIVFDKTGTLTVAAPHVAEVVPFGGNEETEMLRIAACLEEHYPHSVANAVVREAELRGILHEEMHTPAVYVVAHGVRSEVDGREVLIGSYHFVFEDSGCTVPDGEQEKFDAIPPEYSQLYLAIGGKLAAVICIEDALKPEAAETVRQLHAIGFAHVVMMTGDSERTAAAVAAAVGVDEFHAEVLPEQKAEFIRELRQNGHRVMMVGDGVNDSPALSEADAGVAIATGAAIAREIADVVVSGGGLESLVLLRRVSSALTARINSNYRFIMSFNGGLIALGLAGILPPATSALLHNISTICIGMKSMTNLLPPAAQ